MVFILSWTSRWTMPSRFGEAASHWSSSIYDAVKHRQTRRESLPDEAKPMGVVDIHDHYDGTDWTMKDRISRWMMRCWIGGSSALLVVV